jgi:L-methionine (R)-S-oxide reductase
MDSNKKNGRYERILKQLEELLQKPGNPLSRMATVVAVLSHKMDDYFWTGFYLLDGGELMVGPYQGPVACQTLKKGTGVCWAGILQQQTVIVPNVHEFPGHIACDSRSNSEIVVPLKDAAGNVVGVLDVDSKDFNTFDETDRFWLERIVALI